MAGPALTKEQCEQRRTAALIRWSRYDTREGTAKAQAANEARYLTQARTEAIQRGERISDQEALRRADNLKRVFMRSISRKGVEARQARRSA